MTVTLDEARRDLEEGMKRVHERKQKSVTCACCKEEFTLYPRKITSAMARFLIELDRLSGDSHPWVNALEVFKNARMKYDGDYAKLRFWGFIEGTDEVDNPRSGLYRITSVGKQFVHCQLEVARTAYVFRNSLYGFDGKPTNIKVALGDRFDYQELMAG
jgi:hypothetical protein